MIEIGILAAIVGLDRTAFAQSLLAHPIVAATFAGALAGDLASGFWAGVSLSIFSAEHVPVGETRLRDWASVSVALPFALAQQDEATKGLLLLCAALCALPAGEAIRAVRAIVLRMREAVDDELLVVKPAIASRIQLLALLMHLLRGASVGLLIFLFLRLLAAWASPTGSTAEGLRLFWQLAVVGGLPVLFRIHLLPRLRRRLATGSFSWRRA